MVLAPDAGPPVVVVVLPEVPEAPAEAVTVEAEEAASLVPEAARRL